MFEIRFLALIFTSTHLSTDGGVGSQALSSQDVSVHHVLHKGEIHQISPITERNDMKEKYL